MYPDLSSSMLLSSYPSLDIRNGDDEYKKKKWVEITHWIKKLPSIKPIIIGQ